MKRKDSIWTQRLQIQDTKKGRCNCKFLHLVSLTLNCFHSTSVFVCLLLCFLVGVLLKEIGDCPVRRHVSGFFFFLHSLIKLKIPPVLHSFRNFWDITQVAGRSVEENTKSLLVKSMDDTNIGCHTDNCSTQ